MIHHQEYSVLVVDDVADNLLLLQLVLEMEGYRVELADSGAEALSKIKESPPDLVLLDVMMPEMNGLEVTQCLRKSRELSLLPIVLITADRDIDVDQALAVGANDVINKPVDMDDLLARVGNWCPAT
ncbi:response regulator [Phormidium sp. FACHB-592]|uniref:Response regulator n=1 Tax=Stenomitos frigidus AS-A4 TaxID=2933935 RepID=A0ABV0KEE6_9CYAN|nr:MULTISPECIES: response regulator [Cyanophyceae]MBD2034626.1 response regulator [Leptolyngbya sp. FACHB-321]MBD2076170.1 response regulator [Phormidium sp. FACHB-592]